MQRMAHFDIVNFTVTMTAPDMRFSLSAEPPGQAQYEAHRHPHIMRSRSPVRPGGALHNHLPRPPLSG